MPAETGGSPGDKNNLARSSCPGGDDTYADLSPRTAFGGQRPGSALGHFPVAEVSHSTFLHVVLATLAFETGHVDAESADWTPVPSQHSRGWAEDPQVRVTCDPGHEIVHHSIAFVAKW